MSRIYVMVWLLPILFMIHDFEEIIMLKPCQKRNQAYFVKKGYRQYPFNYPESTSAFSIAVLEEFILASLVALISSFTGQVILWYGVFFAFTLHLLFHLITAVKIKRYIGSTFTSIVLLLPCCYILYDSIMYIPTEPVNIALACIVCSVFTFANVYALIKLIPVFEYFLVAFSKGGD